MHFLTGNVVAATAGISIQSQWSRRSIGNRNEIYGQRATIESLPVDAFVLAS